MGCHPNIDATRFPQQGQYLGKDAEVMFNFGGKRIHGVIVRDDDEAPFLTIIRLDDGRHVLATECQYSPRNPATRN